MGYSLETCRTIVAIEKATPPEILEIMKVTHPDGTVSDLKRQLMCAYGCLEPFIKPECIKVAVAQIWSRNALNIEKIKQEKEFIEILKNPESYWKESTQKTDTDKEAAVIGSSDSTSQGTSFNQSKSRSGSSQSYRERDLEREWDKSDEETMGTVVKQPGRNPEASRWAIRETGEEGKSWEVETVPPPPVVEIPAVRLQNADGIEELPLDSVTLNISRSVVSNTSTSAATSGRDIRSRKGIFQHTKSYTKAKAIKELQKLQSIDWRAKVIQEFACLFKGAFGQDLCL